MLTLVPTLIALAALRLRATRDERGAMSTEMVIITAVLATLALAVTAIIVAEVTSKARTIQLD